jgi:hypothetical protein
MGKESEQEKMSLSAEARYREDPVFATLVDMMYHAICQHDYTPTELREAAHMAAIKYEMNHVRSIFIPRASAKDFTALSQLRDQE